MTPPRKRVLIAHPALHAIGGGNGVAAWTIEALKPCCDISLATMRPVDCAAVNRAFGTSLQESDFRLLLAPRRLRLAMALMPGSGALLRYSLLMRFARELDGKERFDVLLGTENEIDFGRRGIQYMHEPWAMTPMSPPRGPGLDGESRAMSAYRWFCHKVSKSSAAGLWRNLSLANSRFTAGEIRDVHRAASTVLYPPAPGIFPEVPWESRARGFVAVGRIIPEKRWDMAVAIIEEVRRRGHEVTLTLIGTSDNAALRQRFAALAEERRWFRVICDASRGELASQIAHHRFGIHTMRYEQFGMAPAEMQRAGCVVFAHNSGGQVEILGGDMRVIFDGIADAADKIERVLASAPLEAELSMQAANRRDCFSTERFCNSLRDIVGNFA